MDNRALVSTIFDGLSKGDGRALVGAMADDFVWTVGGTTVWSRRFEGKRAVIGELLIPLGELFEAPIRLTATRIAVDGDIAAVEATGTARLNSGADYNNRYCFMIRIENGQLKELTEYLDTELAARLLPPPV